MMNDDTSKKPSIDSNRPSETRRRRRGSGSSAASLEKKQGLTFDLDPLLIAAWAVVSAVVLYVYWEPLSWLVNQWIQQSDYVYGFLIIPFSLYMLWERRDLYIQGEEDTPEVRRASIVGGIALILLGVAMRAARVWFFFLIADPYSIVPIVGGITLLAGGWRGFRWAWPSVVFLVFMVPLPSTFAGLLARQLQRVGAVISVKTLQTLGIPAVAQGNTILLREASLDVADACSGIRMLMLFFAACTGAALFMRRRPAWERIVVFLSAPVIAVVSNIARIALTGILYYSVSSELGHKFSHDLAGWFMMPIAIGLLWLELELLSALFIETVEFGSPSGRDASLAPRGNFSLAAKKPSENETET